MKGDTQEYRTGDDRIMRYTRNYEDDSVDISNMNVTITLTKEELKYILR